MAPRLFAVVGDPVSHSLSPMMFRAAIMACGLDAQYVAMRTTAEAFPALVTELLAAGGGCNVTMPFKQQAAELAARRSETVRRTGACNTLYGDSAHPDADNTDVAAIREEAVRLTEGRLARATIVGTGGSARAAAAALAEAFPGAVLDIGSRSLERARDFVLYAAGLGLAARVKKPANPAPVDLLIFATPDPSGRAVTEQGEGSVSRPSVRALLDLRYAKGGTIEVRFAREFGRMAASDGRGVLVLQGAASFEKFFGIPAPLPVMRRAVEDALRP